jgi:hypothetical protein
MRSPENHWTIAGLIEQALDEARAGTVPGMEITRKLSNKYMFITITTIMALLIFSFGRHCCRFDSNPKLARDCPE